MTDNKITILERNSNDFRERYQPNEEEISEREFSDELDIARITIDVDTIIKKELGKDFVLAYLTPQQREFIIEQTKVAYLLERITPTPEIGTLIRKTVMLENHAIALLHRNLEKNPIIQWLLGSLHEEKNETKQEEQLFKQAMDRLRPIDRERQEAI